MPKGRRPMFFFIVLSYIDLGRLTQWRRVCSCPNYWDDDPVERQMFVSFSFGSLHLGIRWDPRNEWSKLVGSWPIQYLSGGPTLKMEQRCGIFRRPMNWWDACLCLNNGLVNGNLCDGEEIYKEAVVVKKFHARRKSKSRIKFNFLDAKAGPCGQKFNHSQ